MGVFGLGLTPVESTIMVAIPELDGAIAPIIFGGRSDGAGEACTGCDRRCVFELHGDAPRCVHVRNALQHWRPASQGS